MRRSSYDGHVEMESDHRRPRPLPPSRTYINLQFKLCRGWCIWGVGMVSSIYCILFIYFCSVDNWFVMKVKDINSVNTYSEGPSLGYKAHSSILIPMMFLIFRLRGFWVSDQDNYLLFILSDFLQKSQSWIDRQAGDRSCAVYWYLV